MTSALTIESCDIEQKNPKAVPKKWLRRLTVSSSYVCRL